MSLAGSYLDRDEFAARTIAPTSLVNGDFIDPTGAFTDPVKIAARVAWRTFVDPHDYAQVAFSAGANVDPARDVVVTEGPADHLDHATVRQFVGGKLGIDATAKLPEEGAREWPVEIEMSAEIRELVDRRWTEYGLGSET